MSGLAHRELCCKFDKYTENYRKIVPKTKELKTQVVTDYRQLWRLDWSLIRYV